METDKVGLAEKLGNVIVTQRILAMSYNRALNQQAGETPNTAGWQTYQPTIEAHMYVLNQLEAVLRDALNHYASYIASLPATNIEQLLIGLNIPDDKNPIAVALYGPPDVPAGLWTISRANVAEWITQELDALRREAYATPQEETQEASNGTE